MEDEKKNPPKNSTKLKENQEEDEESEELEDDFHFCTGVDNENTTETDKKGNKLNHSSGESHLLSSSSGRLSTRRGAGGDGIRLIPRQFSTFEVLSVQETNWLVGVTLALLAMCVALGILMAVFAARSETRMIPFCDSSFYDINNATIPSSSSSSSNSSWGCLVREFPFSHSTGAAASSGTLSWTRIFSWEPQKGVWELHIQFSNAANVDLEGLIVQYRLDVWHDKLDEDEEGADRDAIIDQLVVPDVDTSLLSSGDDQEDEKIMTQTGDVPDPASLYMSKEGQIQVDCHRGEEMCRHSHVIVSPFDVWCSEDDCSTVCAAVTRFKTRLEFIDAFEIDAYSMPVKVEFVHFNEVAFPSFVGVYTAFSCVIWITVGLLIFKSFRAAPWREWVVAHKLGIAFGVVACMQVNFLAVAVAYKPAEIWIYATRWLLMAFGYILQQFFGLVIAHSYMCRSSERTLPFRVYRWKIPFVAFIAIPSLVFFLIGVSTDKQFIYLNVFGNGVAPTVSFYNTATSGYKVSEKETAAFLFFACLSLSWIMASSVWIIVLTVRVVRHLARLPYLTCRFRHLAVKTNLYFFVLVFVCDVLYITLTILFAPYIYISGMFANLLNPSVLLASLLSTIYVYLLVPAGISGHSIDAFLANTKGFDIADARLCILFASEAYEYHLGDTITEINAKAHNYTLLNVAFNEEHDTCGIVCRKGGKLVVAYRGTESRTNVKTDLKMEQTKIGNDWVKSARRRSSASVVTGRERLYDRLGRVADNVAHALGRSLGVHRGFWEVHMRGKEDIIAEICKHWSPADGAVYLTGHSLGGALASLLAFELSVKHDIPCVLYTFGCPRVGNKRFAKCFRMAVPLSYRVCMDGDVVTGFPKWNYRPHEENEVVIDNKGNLFVNLLGYEKALMTKSRRKVSSHYINAYQHAINAAIKVDHRLGIWLDMEEGHVKEDKELFLFKKDRVSLKYAFASVLPVAALSGQVLNASHSDVPKPVVGTPPVMSHIDDSSENPRRHTRLFEEFIAGSSSSTTTSSTDNMNDSDGEMLSISSNGELWDEEKGGRNKSIRTWTAND
eukprot:Nk52_evm10s1892 gene=Nk52_evmTU10s1892